MCGKFTQMKRYRELVRLAELIGVAGDDGIETITPMRFVQIIALDDRGERKSVRMRWGLIASRARDPMGAKPHIHARAETIDSKPAFRECFARRRGLVVVSSFNEGEAVTPTRTVQHVLTPKDGRPVTIAVIWDRWGETRADVLLTFAMVTVPANGLVATITDRMPALLDDDDWPKWLGEEAASTDELKAMLRPSVRDFDMRRATKPPTPRSDEDEPRLF